jgi:carbon-monoxide dehydrogenase medium subunit
MYETNYHRASSVEDAVKLRGAGEDSTYLSGGMTLISTMKQRLAAPTDLIDLRHIPALRGIAIDGRRVTIGAATPHADVANSAELHAICPAICHVARHIGDPHVRNMGTIGGSIANNDPAADYPAAVLGLGATVITDRRSILADDFFTGLFETALDEGEMVTGVSFDAPEMAGYAKFNNPASRFAMTGVFVARTAGGVRVAVTGAGSAGVFREERFEQALAAQWSAEVLADLPADASNLMADLHADEEYRANLVKVMAKRAVASAA